MARSERILGRAKNREACASALAQDGVFVVLCYRSWNKRARYADAVYVGARDGWPAERDQRKVRKQTKGWPLRYRVIVRPKAPVPKSDVETR